METKSVIAILKLNEPPKLMFRDLQVLDTVHKADTKRSDVIT